MGIVSNGGVRDNDEIIKEQIPVYMNIVNRGRGIRPGRNELESVNKPVVIGGVLINPGILSLPTEMASLLFRGTCGGSGKSST